MAYLYYLSTSLKQLIMERVEEVKLIIQGLNVEIESIESLLKWYKGQELDDKQTALRNYGIQRISTVERYITGYEMERRSLITNQTT